VWNGGIMVPFIITGPGVAQGETSHALVNSTDLFSTMMEMAGINFEETVPDNIAHDSVSLMPYLSDPDHESIREWIYVDRFNTEEGVKAGEYAIRDQKYKYLNDEGTEYFYDLEVDPYEYNNLLEGELSTLERNRFASLKAQIEALHSSEE